MNLENAAAVSAAWRDMTSRLSGRMTSGLVQELVPGGVEMLIGATDDPTFGPSSRARWAGRSPSWSTTAVRLHPISEQDATDMVGNLRGARLLRGYRGAPPADKAALRECLLRLSALVEICPEIRELDVNPLRVLPHGARALDVRARRRAAAAGHGLAARAVLIDRSGADPLQCAA